MCIIREMRENARNLKREMCEMRNARETREREMRERRDICEMRNAKRAIYAKTRSARKCENAKIAALQQVQYKVLLYGLYMPVET
jgi:hypothetical protein